MDFLQQYEDTSKKAPKVKKSLGYFDFDKLEYIKKWTYYSENKKVF